MGFLNKKSKKVINMYVTVSSKRKDAMRKYFLLFTLCGLSTSVYAMRMREGDSYFTFKFSLRSSELHGTTESKSQCNV